MKELSLFSGAGGGLLASKYFLNHRIVGYVEIDDYCQRLIKHRIEDGFLDAAPIFGAIETFVNDGYADAYKGLVDIVTAGFPCQPFSVAGKKKAEKDDRNLWPSVASTIKIVRPEWVFLENVSNITSFQYFGKILSDLSGLGYNARWCCMAASDAGARHERNRFWLLAYFNDKHGNVS